jgi:hypothetical protein
MEKRQINQELLKRIEKKLNIKERRVYQLIEKKVIETRLDRHLAAIVLAMDLDINTSKYASSEDLAKIRGSTTYDLKNNISTPTIIKHTKKIYEPDLEINLDFVSNKELKSILERDISELNIARTQGLSKTCMILVGSIAEALLLEILSMNLQAAQNTVSALNKKIGTNLEEWSLNDMVEISINMVPPLLPPDIEVIAKQLGKWRNLIHPGRELRDLKNKRIKPSPGRAKNAVSFLQIIVEELSKNMKVKK